MILRLDNPFVYPIRKCILHNSRINYESITFNMACIFQCSSGNINVQDISPMIANTLNGVGSGLRFEMGVYNNHCLLQFWSFFLFWWEAIMGGSSPSSFEAPSFCIMISSCKFPTTKDFAPNYCELHWALWNPTLCTKL